MAKVGTIADQNVVPLSQMQKEIINLSNALGVNANVVAEDVYNAISAGQNTADAVGFVEKATMLAKGGFAETGQALDVLTTILNAYGKESSEGVKQIFSGIWEAINPFLVSFDSLDGIVLTKGIWNAERQRIEC